MHTLITHHRPHLDDVAAMWLLERFLPECKDAQHKFVSASEREPEGAVTDRTWVGVGRGRFDEHKGDIGECAATLVFAHVRGRADLDEDTLRALERIVHWVLLEDTGKLINVEQRFFTLPVMLRGEFERTGEDSASLVDFGYRCLDALLVAHRSITALEEDWDGRQEFESHFGPAVAVVTESQHYLDTYAYERGFRVLVQLSPDGTYRTIRVPAETDIDLRPVYDALMELEPDAGWYYHHSGKLIIIGGDLAPDTVRSEVPLEKIIELLQ
ncbi:chromate resistance protein ChrB domain-containing protein [Patescibacteria group bacterium]